MSTTDTTTTAPDYRTATGRELTIAVARCIGFAMFEDSLERGKNAWTFAGSGRWGMWVDFSKNLVRATSEAQAWDKAYDKGILLDVIDSDFVEFYEFVTDCFETVLVRCDADRQGREHSCTIESHCGYATKDEGMAVAVCRAVCAVAASRAEKGTATC